MKPRKLRVIAPRNRGVIRIGIETLGHPALTNLTHLEYRVLTLIWVWVARHGKDGEVPRDWLFHLPLGGVRGRPLRLRPSMLERFLELELLEEYVYDDNGERVIVVVGWRSFRPVDLTSAERKRRHRRKLYGVDYHGTAGEVQEVRLPQPKCARAQCRDAGGER